MRKSFRYKAKVSKSAARKADWQLRLCRELYNAALQERRDAWKLAGESVGFYHQCRQLTEVRQVRPEYAQVDREMLEGVLRKLDRAFDGFFRRVETGDKPGFPRFRGRSRYNSLTFRRTGWKLEGRHLTLRGIGRLKLFLSRPVEGDVKTVTIKRDRVGDWFVTFSCDNVPEELLPETGRAVGVDLGLASFLATSDGAFVPNPRHLRAAEAELKRTQRIVSKRKRGGSRRRKAVKILARKHRKVQRARRDFHFKTALDLVRQYDIIAVEDLNIRGLARTRLAKSIGDAGWDQFIAILSSKAEEAGRQVVKVDPRGTSQVCSGCGAEPEERKTLAVRTHRCSDCGLVLDRDVNAALNILKRARAEPSVSCPRSQAAA